MQGSPLLRASATSSLASCYIGRTALLVIDTNTACESHAATCYTAISQANGNRSEKHSVPLTSVQDHNHNSIIVKTLPCTIFTPGWVLPDFFDTNDSQDDPSETLSRRTRLLPVSLGRVDLEFEDDSISCQILLWLDWLSPSAGL